MQKIIFIGTIHGFTPIKDLEEIFEKYKPNQILIEICQKDVLNNSIESYPKEMIEAYHWAKNNKIKVVGFDSKINVFAEKKTEEDNKKVIEEEGEIIKKHGWKDFNKEKFLELLDKLENGLTDERKFRLRQEKMFCNITDNLAEGTNIIITGAGHLKFFENKFPVAIFPLRN